MEELELVLGREQSRNRVLTPISVPAATAVAHQRKDISPEPNALMGYGAKIIHATSRIRRDHRPASGASHITTPNDIGHLRTDGSIKSGSRVEDLPTEAEAEFGTRRDGQRGFARTCSVHSCAESLCLGKRDRHDVATST
eukprot:scaffold43322_cov28-Tisochrysis_lutea.AAC.12